MPAATARRVLAASWRARGPHVLRFDADAPCDLRAMHALVMDEIGQVLADGELVRDARMEFFVTPGRAVR